MRRKGKRRACPLSKKIPLYERPGAEYITYAPFVALRGEGRGSLIKPNALMCMAIVLATAVSVHAADLASDVSTDSAYADGWQNGDNGGTGFGAWSWSVPTNTANSGYFLGSSAGNGDGDGNLDDDINDGGNAFGIYANSGGAVAVRTFTGGGLTVGQQFTLSFDNGFVDPSTSVGFVLEDSSSNDLLDFRFTGGNANYTVFDNSGSVDTGIGFTDEGLNLTFTLTGANSYSLLIAPLVGTSTNITGTLLNSGDVEQVRIFNINAGSGSSFDMYVNDLQVIPEPSTMALTGLGVLGLVAARRRMKKS
jgi:hypothetical protein